MSGQSADVQSHGNLRVKNLIASTHAGAYDGTRSTNAKADLILRASSDDYLTHLTGTLNQNAATLTFSTDTQIKGVSAPSASNDAANKGYIDSAVSALESGLHVKQAVQTSSTQNNAESAGSATTLTLPSGGDVASIIASTSFTFDGVLINTTTQRILLKDQTNSQYNGIYHVAALGDITTSVLLTRDADANTAAEMVQGSFVFVEDGTNQGNGYYQLSVKPTTLGTDPIQYAVFTSTTMYDFLGVLRQSGKDVRITGADGGADTGLFLTGSASTAADSTYTSTFGPSDNAVALKLNPPNTLQTSLAASDANIIKGAVHTSHNDTIADTEYTPGLVMGSATAQYSGAVVQHRDGTTGETLILQRGAGANSWSAVAAFFA